MKYRIELAATAKADIRRQGQWLCDEVSTAAADQWLAGLYKTIDALQTRPLRCPLAAENDKFREAQRFFIPRHVLEHPRSRHLLCKGRLDERLR
jgi:plasmid stabilization system protein ParE